MTLHRIDLNADLGENTISLRNGHDEELMQLVTSVNIACGGHAGDQDSMTRTLEVALKHGVAAGAHPSYPDRPNFGRAVLDIGLSDLKASLAEQIETLRSAAARVGIRIGHVKPHGALYHALNDQPELPQLLAEVVLGIDPSMAVICQAGKLAATQLRKLGLRVVSEAFADRRYKEDGGLVERNLRNALLDAQEAGEQALDIALHGCVLAGNKRIDIHAETICIHSDTPNARAIAERVRGDLMAHGIELTKFAS